MQTMEMTAKYQRAVGEFVNREVDCCLSQLMSHLQKVDISHIESYFHLYEAPHDPTSEEEGTCGSCEMEDMWLDDDNECHACYSEHPRDVLEHWAVSNYLADELEEHGEAVEKDFYGLCVWGRCTSGQAISMDGVIQSIYNEMKA